MHDRLVALAGVQNFRDFGGYAGTRGRVKRRRLYRSAHLAAATESDTAHLGGLGLSVIVDLRKQSERQRDPSRLPVGFSGLVVDSDEGPPGHAPHQGYVDRELTPDMALRVMNEFYRDAPFDAVQLGLAKRYFAALAETEGAVLVHCAAGKDRTGFLVALTQAALGIHRDDIVADYLLTNAATRMDARLPELTRVMHGIYGRPVPEPVVRAFLTVAAEYIDMAFLSIEREGGGLERYLAERVGIDTALLARIEARLLE